MWSVEDGARARPTEKATYGKPLRRASCAFFKLISSVGGPGGPTTPPAKEMQYRKPNVGIQAVSSMNNRKAAADPGVWKKYLWGSLHCGF